MSEHPVMNSDEITKRVEELNWMIAPPNISTVAEESKKIMDAMRYHALKKKIFGLNRNEIFYNVYGTKWVIK